MQDNVFCKELCVNSRSLCRVYMYLSLSFFLYLFLSFFLS